MSRSGGIASPGIGCWIMRRPAGASITLKPWFGKLVNEDPRFRRATRARLVPHIRFPDQSFPHGRFPRKAGIPPAGGCHLQRTERGAATGRLAEGAPPRAPRAVRPPAPSRLDAVRGGGGAPGRVAERCARGREWALT